MPKGVGSAEVALTIPAAALTPPLPPPPPPLLALSGWGCGPTGSGASRTLQPNAMPVQRCRVQTVSRGEQEWGKGKQ